MKESGRKEIPFNGKLMTGEPASIGMNFQSLVNLSYTDTHLKSIKGMTKINTTALDTYLKTRSAFHFVKSQPPESHVLAQAYNAAETAAKVVENTTAIPSAGDFSSTALLTDSSGFGLGRFSDAPDGQIIYCNGVDTCIWGGNEVKVGALIQTTTALSATTDVCVDPLDVTEKANNTKTDAANLFTCGGSYKTFIVGSTRPAKGAKIYISSANTTANTLVVKESTASTWDTLTVTSDGTRTGGTKSFAQTGTISWATTVATTKPKYLSGYYLYWYQFTIDDGSASIYHVTLDLPFQNIIDMWDGVYRDIAKFYVYTTSETDKTVNVLKKDYEATSAFTYADISSLTNAQSMVCGFTEKITGLFISLPPDYVNATHAIASVSYWDGSAYQPIADITDGTLYSITSFLHSGVISWNNSAISGEQKLQYANAEPLYYYKISFDHTIGAGVRVDYIAGMTASKEINHYKFPVFAQGRILLCCDMSGEKNKAICSSKYMPQVYNGDDSVDIYFGEEGELTCGTELFSQFGSSLYSLVLMFKNNETWVMAGQDINQWADNTFLLSSSIGCPAPLTLKTINLHAEPGAGVNRALAIWQGANGIYMSDGRAPIPIHGDIKEYFDDADSRCIPASMIGSSVAWVDHKLQHYHWIFSAGVLVNYLTDESGNLLVDDEGSYLTEEASSEGLNTELVYDIARNRWFEINRTVDLQCGVSVHDTDGNSYSYGFLDTGYMHRLEYGAKFDGANIPSTVQFGDMPLGGLDVETRVTDVTLFTVAKASDITCTHYGDTSIVGTEKTMDHTSLTRLATPFFNEKLNGYFHSLKYETVGEFEPLATVIWFQPL